jgi:hypothetical protein
LESWAHFNPNILNSGRVTHFVNPLLSEDERQAQYDSLNEQDPEIERLKLISDDKRTLITI